MDSYKFKLMQLAEAQNINYGDQWFKRQQEEKAALDSLTKRKRVSTKPPKEFKRAPAKFYIAKALGLSSTAQSGNNESEANAEKYLKNNGLDAYVYGNVDGRGKTVIAIKKPADKDYWYNGKYQQHPEHKEILLRAVRFAGGKGFPTIEVGYKSQKENTFNKKEIEKRIAERPKFIIHKKDGTNITFKNNGSKVVEDLEALWNYDVITEEEIYNSLFDDLEEDSNSSYFNY